MRRAAGSGAIERPVDPELIHRFLGGLARLFPEDGKLALAVSGGPDSLALLLIAAAALPGRVEAATVDHGLRLESAGEASEVAAICADLDQLGIVLDAGSNAAVRAVEGDLSAPGSRVRILVIPTNEELVVARETRRLVGGNSK